MSLTLSKLINEYRTDPVSPYQQLRWKTKENSDSLTRRLHAEHGRVRIADIRPVTLRRWYQTWTKNGTEKIPQAHSFAAQLRTLMGFGILYLEDNECARVSAILRQMKFPNGKPRTTHLTAAQADLIRTAARAAQLPSIALAQAFQFENAFRQKDVIGEYVPQSEPGVSDVMWDGWKWLRGLRWNEIDSALILKHVTSKKNKLVTHDLTLAPMILDELARAYPGFARADGTFDRAVLPASGPIINNEKTTMPWIAYAYRNKWRELARSVGIPDNVQNRDSRAGAITEATNSGAGLEDAKELAGHSDVATTQIYSRDRSEKATKAQRARVASRPKTAAAQ